MLYIDSLPSYDPEMFENTKRMVLPFLAGLFACDINNENIAYVKPKVRYAAVLCVVMRWDLGLSGA